MRRFVIPTPKPDATMLTITGDLYRHMARVLRLTPETDVLLTDGSGREWQGRLTRIDREALEVTLFEHCEPAPGSGPEFILYQGLAKGDKTEQILQKTTELGVTAVVIFSGERSVPKIDAVRQKERLSRWQRIACEAARQSGRRTIPAVSFAGGLAEGLAGRSEDLRLLLWEGEQFRRLGEVLAQSTRPASIGLLVGPEGGFTPAEVADATSRGAVPVTLGPRVLRTETAGPATLAILQFALGDMR